MPPFPFPVLEKASSERLCGLTYGAEREFLLGCKVHVDDCSYVIAGSSCDTCTMNADESDLKVTYHVPRETRDHFARITGSMHLLEAQRSVDR